MPEIKIGLIPCPDLPTTLAYDLKDELPTYFSQTISPDVDWTIDIMTNPLVGAAEDTKEIMGEAEEVKQKEKWDFALALTDLPLYDGKDLVLADAEFKKGIAQLSVPAFGSFPLRFRVRKVVIQIVKELYYNGLKKGAEETASTNETNEARKSKGFIKHEFLLSTIRRNHSSPLGKSMDLHFIIRPRFHGKLRILSGMTFANRPWAIIPSFKPVVAVAFATGAYGLIFPTLWKLSAAFGLPRFIGLMIAAIFSIVAWIISSHQLWEKPTEHNRKAIRKLYNKATVLTLIVAVLFYYMVLFVLFFITVFLFVPPDLFKNLTNMHESVDFGNYLRLAWLAASIATFAGSIGAGLENKEMVHDIMYGYRQRVRSKKSQKQREENPEFN